MKAAGSPLYRQWTLDGRRRLTANELIWWPWFDKALSAYLEGSATEFVTVDVDSVMGFIHVHRKQYPPVEDPIQVRRLLNAYFKDNIGPLWDGAKYVKKHKGIGRRIELGVETALTITRHGSVS